MDAERRKERESAPSTVSDKARPADPPARRRDRHAIRSGRSSHRGTPSERPCRRHERTARGSAGRKTAATRRACRGQHAFRAAVTALVETAASVECHGSRAESALPPLRTDRRRVLPQPDAAERLAHSAPVPQSAGLCPARRRCDHRRLGASAKFAYEGPLDPSDEPRPSQEDLVLVIGKSADENAVRRRHQ